MIGIIIFFILIAVPILELNLLINVGSDIGSFSTVMLCLLTAMIGMALVRMQGIKVFRDIQAAQVDGLPIGTQLVHGLFLAVSGICLFIPGFITDTVGALLLIPPLRLLLGNLVLKSIILKTRTHQQDSQGGIVIEGEFVQANPHAKSHQDEETIEVEYTDLTDKKGD